MFVYKWTVSDVVKGTALVKQIGDCTVKDKGESTWIPICSKHIVNFKSFLRDVQKTMFNLHVHVHQQHFIKVHWDREMTLDSQINKHLECASLIQQES